MSGTKHDRTQKQNRVKQQVQTGFIQTRGGGKATGEPGEQAGEKSRASGVSVPGGLSVGPIQVRYTEGLSNKQKYKGV